MNVDIRYIYDTIIIYHWYIEYQWVSPVFRWVISSVRNWDARSLPETSGGGSGGKRWKRSPRTRERTKSQSAKWVVSLNDLRMRLRFIYYTHI